MFSNDIENHMVIGNDDTPCPAEPRRDGVTCEKCGCYDECEKEAHEDKKCLDDCCICEALRDKADYSTEG